MKREIEFKVWDNENKEFSNWTNRDPHFNVSNGRLFFWERTRKEDGSYNGDIILQDHGDRFILLQYTGCKDKNGTPIYEGDILANDLIIPHDNDNIGVVYFAAGTYMIDGDGPFYDHVYGHSPDILDNHTVIGNKFENSELLKA